MSLPFRFGKTRAEQFLRYNTPPGWIEMNSPDPQNGFSLIELTISMTITLMIISGVAVGLSALNSQFNSQKQRLNATNNAQMAIDSMVRVIRMSGSRPASCASSFQ